MKRSLGLAVICAACASAPEPSAIATDMSEGDPIQCLTRALRAKDYVITSTGADAGVVVAEVRSEAGPAATMKPTIWILTFRVPEDGEHAFEIREGPGAEGLPGYAYSSSRRGLEDFARRSLDSCTSGG